jgi:hypothetical protein
VLKASFLTAVVAVALACWAPAMGEDKGSGSSGKHEPTVSADRLKFRLRAKSKVDCRTRCRRPISVTDKIYCCTVCLEAQWICTSFSCGCEVPVDKKQGLR